MSFLLQGANVAGAAGRIRWPCPRCTNAKPRRWAGARGGEGKEGTWRGQSKVTNRVALVASGPNEVLGAVHARNTEPYITASLARAAASRLTSCEDAKRPGTSVTRLRGDQRRSRAAGKSGPEL